MNINSLLNEPKKRDILMLKENLLKYQQRIHYEIDRMKVLQKIYKTDVNLLVASTTMFKLLLKILILPQLSPWV